MQLLDFNQEYTKQEMKDIFRSCPICSKRYQTDHLNILSYAIRLYRCEKCQYIIGFRKFYSSSSTNHLTSFKLINLHLKEKDISQNTSIIIQEDGALIVSSNYSLFLDYSLISFPAQLNLKLLQDIKEKIITARLLT